jgi:hypothetical protein
MKELRFTLLSDGKSDQALIPLLTWLLITHHVECAIQPAWADPQRLPRPPLSLSERIRVSLEIYPCDLLFVHRDAEREPREHRVAEIENAKRSITELGSTPVLCVIPVRMQEAWLLFDEMAIRWAAGNRNGKMPLHLPQLRTLEQLPDPKDILHELLREASGLHGRRRQRVPTAFYAQRVAEFIEDFSPLRALPAFQALDDDIEQVVHDQGWQFIS